MIYKVKIKDKNGKLKSVMSAKACHQRYWRSLGHGLYNEFTGANIEPKHRGNKLKRVVCFSENCEIEFQKHTVRHMYCSVRCAQATALRRKELQRARARVGVKKHCLTCKKEFSPDRKQRYCYDPCTAPHYGKVEPTAKVCIVCHQKFKTSSARKINCSPECAKENFLSKKRKNANARKNKKTGVI